MSETKIMKCNCKNDFQDKKYGKKNRLFNRTIKGFRCTVCGSDKGIQIEKKKK